MKKVDMIKTDEKKGTSKGWIIALCVIAGVIILSFITFIVLSIAGISTAAMLPILLSGRDGIAVQKREILPDEETRDAQTIARSAYLTVSEEEASSAKRIPADDEFNEDGTRAIYVKRNSQGIILFATYYDYDDEGAVICESKYNSLGLLAEKTVYFAEDEGCTNSVLTPKKNSYGDYDGYTFEEYKQNGSLYKSVEYTSTGSVASYTEATAYDQAGRIQLENVYPAYGEQPTSFKEYTYNTAGKIDEINEYDFDNVLIEKAAYEYDEFGRVSKISYFQMGACRKYDAYSYYPEEGYYSITPYTLANQITKSYTTGTSVQKIYDP